MAADSSLNCRVSEANCRLRSSRTGIGLRRQLQPREDALITCIPAIARKLRLAWETGNPRRFLVASSIKEFKHLFCVPESGVNQRIDVGIDELGGFTLMQRDDDLFRLVGFSSPR